MPRRCSPACWLLPGRACRTASGRPSRRTSTGPSETSSALSTPASTSAWSKGAYVEPPGRALPYGEPTDVAYLKLAHHLGAAGARFSLATHDGVLREALLAALGPQQMEQLLGVRPDVLADLTARGVPVRVYVAFGDGWFRYWMRRVAESRRA